MQRTTHTTTDDDLPDDGDGPLGPPHRPVTLRSPEAPAPMVGAPGDRPVAEQPEQEARDRVEARRLARLTGLPAPDDDMEEAQRAMWLSDIASRLGDASAAAT